MAGTKGKKRVTAIQAALAALVVAGLAWLGFKLLGYDQAQQVYRDMEAAYAGGTGASPVDFASLQEDYPDVVAWIEMDDVDVSYPIVQGEDNDHYLHHDPGGAESIDGSIFLDYRNNGLADDLHVLVYGHNMRDESMFGQLDRYVDERFYRDGTGMFSMYTPDGVRRYQIFAVDIVDPSDEVYEVGFKDTAVFDAFVGRLEASSRYGTGVDASGYDQVVTLSTCSDANRLVLSAKRVR